MKWFAYKSFHWEKAMSGELSDALDTDDDETVALSPDDVAVFLMRNPTFFSDHPDVLDYVELPDRFKAGGVVDFQRYQLQRRESEIDELRTTAQDVIETSRSNMSIQTRTRSFLSVPAVATAAVKV